MYDECNEHTAAPQKPTAALKSSTAAPTAPPLHFGKYLLKYMYTSATNSYRCTAETDRCTLEVYRCTDSATAAHRKRLASCGPRLPDVQNGNNYRRIDMTTAAPQSATAALWKLPLHFVIRSYTEMKKLFNTYMPPGSGCSLHRQ